MTAEHLETGKKGEELAAEYLAAQGLEIIHQNWRIGKNEIDIIAHEKNKLVIVEVKTRTAPYLVEPEVAVDMKKQRLLFRAANAYIKINRINLDVRFDIVSVVIFGKNYKITHIRDAFYPTLYHRG
jgi:putative endonuclease